LDARLCGEVAHAVRGMSRQQANELVRRLLAIYEPDLKNNPIGKPFEEVYDVENVKPTAEWLGMYEEVCEDLIKMGVPFGKNVP
jgi:methylamine--corrinoid protein Co-methyltransferase